MFKRISRSALIALAALSLPACNPHGSGRMEIFLDGYFRVGSYNRFGVHEDPPPSPGVGTHLTEIEIVLNAGHRTARIDFVFPAYTLTETHSVGDFDCRASDGDRLLCTGTEDDDGRAHHGLRFEAELHAGDLVSLRVEDPRAGLVAYFGDSKSPHRWPAAVKK